MWKLFKISKFGWYSIGICGVVGCFWWWGKVLLKYYSWDVSCLNVVGSLWGDCSCICGGCYLFWNLEFKMKLNDFVILLFCYSFDDFFVYY